MCSFFVCFFLVIILGRSGYYFCKSIDHIAMHYLFHSIIIVYNRGLNIFQHLGADFTCIGMTAKDATHSNKHSPSYNKVVLDIYYFVAVSGYKDIFCEKFVHMRSFDIPVMWCDLLRIGYEMHSRRTFRRL